jgi:hypothetical protein
MPDVDEYLDEVPSLFRNLNTPRDLAAAGL